CLLIKFSELVITKFFYNGEITHFQHFPKILKRKSKDFFDKTMLFAPVIQPDCFDNLLVFKLLIYPEGNSGFLLYFKGYKFAENLFGVEKIDHKDTLRFQRIVKYAKRLNMFLYGFEIAETGEKIESVIVAVAAIFFSHILNHELKTVGLVFSGVSDAGFRKVDACCHKSFITHILSVSSASAGDVEQGGVGLRVKMFEQIIYKCSRFLVIAIFV